MAQDTAITALTNAAALGDRVQVMSRKIDFAVTPLASGDHFELFELGAGDIVLGGGVVVTAVSGAGNEDLTIGIGGTGTTLLTATPVDTSNVVAFVNTAALAYDSDTIDLAMTVDAADRGTVEVAVVILRITDPVS